MSRKYFFLLLGVAFWASSSEDLMSAEVAGPFTLKDVEKAWALREARNSSLRLSWKAKEFTPRGAIVPETMRGRTMLPAPLPPYNRESVYFRLLLVDKGRVRFTERGDYWSGPAQRYAPAEFTIVWNGTEGRAFDHFPGKGAHREGRIVKTFAEVALATASAPLLAMWPLHSDLGAFRMEHYCVTSRTSRIDGHCCTLLRKASGDLLHNEIWVDPERDYLITRVDSRDGDFLSSHLRLQYANDPVHGFYPVQWRWVTMKSPNAIRSTVECEVVDHTFVPVVQDKDFTIDFPTGCLVHDRRAAEPVRYLVLPNGQYREVLDEETEPGAALPGPSIADKWGVIACLTVVITSAMLLVLRRWFISRP